jgi:osmotically-inducible protein OsmY
MITVSATGEKAHEVAWQAYDLMSAHQVLRTTTSDINIDAVDGKLTIGGRVRTNVIWNLAYRLARTAANGWQLQVNLISDEALTLTLARKIAQDPDTTTANVRPDVYLGVLHLRGTVDSAEQRDAVLKLAHQEPGVVKVEDSLSILR